MMIFSMAGRIAYHQSLNISGNKNSGKAASHKFSEKIYLRISQNEKKVIVDSILTSDPLAKIYLFGSRADDMKKGGDIDILIFSEKIDLSEKIKIKTRIFQKMEEQKIDLLVAKDKNDPFVRLALEKGVQLK